jgi:DNA repair exonuclease SbcCD ATPase subunit
MSTVVLKQIEWDRCFSFGDTNEVSLSDEAVTQIIGPNGFGKSSIPLIIEESLFNKNSKGVKKEEIPNRSLSNGYSINLMFNVDNDEFQILTERKSSIKVRLFKNGTDISSHTATNTFKQIEEIVGMDFKIFQQLIYQSTDSALAFLSATDTARKKFLIDLFDLSEYTQLFEVFRDATKAVTSQSNTLQGKVDTIKKWLLENSSLPSELLPIYEIPDRVDYSDEIGDLRSKISQVESINASILRNNKVKATLAQYNRDKLEEDSKGNIQSYDEYQAEIGTLRSEKQAADTVITKLKSLKDKCPTCLQDVDVAFYQELLLQSVTSSSSAEGRISSLEEAINSIKRTNSVIVNAKAKLAEVDKLQVQVDSTISTELLDSSELENELAGLRKIVTNLDTDIANLQKLNNEAIGKNSRIELYHEQKSKFEKDLSEVVTEMQEVTSRLKNLEVLKKAFSTNGLIAYELENLVKDLEVYTNEYLSELSDGRFTIEFAISNDKLNVVLTDEGKEISMVAPSSGEKARINISTLLAIRKLMSDISKNTINVLFLDEVISVLDDYGRERLVEVLLKEQGLNTFLVSHSWTHPLVSKLEVKKEAGISWIERG